MILLLELFHHSKVDGAAVLAVKTVFDEVLFRDTDIHLRVQVGGHFVLKPLRRPRVVSLT